MSQSFGPPVEHPQATTILVLGVLSLLCCGLLGPVAWVMGKKALNEIENSQGRYGGRAQVNIGYILGIVATAFMVLGFLVWLMLIIRDV